MLCEYAHAELAQPEDQGRTVVSNQHWIAIVPWWATWPFEILREYSFLHSSDNQIPNATGHKSFLIIGTSTRLASSTKTKRPHLLTYLGE